MIIIGISLFSVVMVPWPTIGNEINNMSLVSNCEFYDGEYLHIQLTLFLSRMIIGLIFPELTDEITVICPDYTVQDLVDTISKILDIKEAGLEVERMVVGKVEDTDTYVFNSSDMDNIKGEYSAKY